LREAKQANSRGQGSKAYSLASQSLRKSPTVAARQEMVVAACRMRNKSKASSNLKKIPLLQRRSPKKRCKALGVRL
jgi:hypothetical protein